MGPATNNIDSEIDHEDDQQDQADAPTGPVSDMRRMSLALAFSPARQRRRDKMNALMFGWLKSFGMNKRRSDR